MTASMVLLLAPILDRELLATQSPWLDMAYTILDEMISQGQLQASARKEELHRLQQLFQHFTHPLPLTPAAQNSISHLGQAQGMDDFGDMLDGDFIDDAIWRTDLTAEQLMAIAENLDLDGLDWMTTDSSNFPD
jgi:proline utilization trans-activator